jgi:FkbM family methyltransferase
VAYGCRVPDHRGKWILHEHIRRCFGIEINTEQVVTRRGLRWALNPSDFAQSQLYWFGVRDPWELYHVIRLLPPESLILQAGANFGYFAATIATALGSQCRIVALEPYPDNYAALARHVRWNGLERQIECHQFGVSDAAGIETMVRPENNSGHAHIVLGGQGAEVRLKTIDRVVEDLNCERLDALLIDVEGYEGRALRGASQTLARFRPLLLVELWPPAMSQQGTTVESAVELLQMHDYHLYYARKRKLLPVTELPTGDNRLYAFCFHRDRIPPSLETLSPAARSWRTWIPIR